MLAWRETSRQQGQVSTRYTYRHSGLIIASQIELPEWEVFSCDGSDADVRIDLSDAPCPACPSNGLAFEGDTLRFVIEGVGGWQIEGGHTITLHPDPSSGPAELRLFTLGSAWGALGYQRGLAMWHGSAVECDGRAILFCGDAGAGKSTMAAAFVKEGARLVSDDLSRIEVADGNAVIHPSSLRIKLWREAIDRFGWQDRILQRDFFREDKFHCGVPAHCAREKPLPLDAVIVLEESPQPNLARLSGAQALEQVIGQTLYRPEMLDAMGLWGQQGALAAVITENVEVWRFARPKSFASDTFRLAAGTVGGEGQNLGALRAFVQP